MLLHDSYSLGFSCFVFQIIVTYRCWSTLVQVMACYLMAPNHNLNQRLFIVDMALQVNFTQIFCDLKVRFVFVLIQCNAPLPWCVKLRVAHAPGMPRSFSPPPRVSDPDLHHGTCLTHVPWCMPGSLTNGFLWGRWRGKRPRYSRRMRNPQFYVSDKRPMLHTTSCFTGPCCIRAQLLKCMPAERCVKSGMKNYVNWKSTHWPLGDFNLILGR